MDQSLIYKAGIVPYREKKSSQKAKTFEVLIVSSRKYPGQWVFPVGTVEKGESVARAALRECAEESGYSVALGEEIDTVIINSNKQSSKFIFFSGLVIKEHKVWENDRERCWCELNDVVGMIAQPFKKVAEMAINILKESKAGE